MTLIEVHHLKGFKLAIAIAILFDFGKFGLNLAHESSLVHLAFNQWPKTNLNKYREKNNGETKVANKAINDEKHVSDWADDQKIN